MIGKQAKKILSNQDGSVIVLALILLVLLTLMGLSAINTSTLEVKIADNEKRYKMTLYAADAGIEAGRAALDMLKDDDAGNWDNLFSNYNLNTTIQLVGQTVADVYTLKPKINCRLKD